MIYRNLNPRGSRLTGQLFVLSPLRLSFRRGQRNEPRVYLSFLHQRRIRTGRKQELWRCSEAGKTRWNREERVSLSPGDSGRLSLSLSLGIFNYSLREESRKNGKKITRRGPLSNGSVRRRTLLCVYLVLLIASAWSDSTITAERRSRISVCSTAPMQPVALVCTRFIDELVDERTKPRARSKSEPLSNNY